MPAPRYLIGSFAFHLLCAVALFGLPWEMLDSSLEAEEETAVLVLAESELVHTEQQEPEAPTAEERPEPQVEEPAVNEVVEAPDKPLEFQAAEAVAETETPIEEEPAEPETVTEPELAALPNEEAEAPHLEREAAPQEPPTVLPTALGQAAGFTRKEGLLAPSFLAVVLTVEEMDRLTAAGQGSYIVLCGKDRYIVRGSLRQPASVRPISARDLESLSQRALPVAGDQCHAVRSKLRLSFAVSEGDAAHCQVWLVISNRLDQYIYGRQCAAVAAEGRKVEEAEFTVGRLLFVENGVQEYAIDRIAWREPAAGG